MYIAGLTDMPHNTSVDTDLSDELVLIQECIAGNRKAQTVFFELYAPFLKGVIARYISDNEWAKDLLSEIFIRIFSKLDLYAPTGPFKGWLRTLAVNTIIDHIRKNKKLETTQSSDFTVMDPYVNSSALSSVGYKELLTLIESLPETQRLVFNLFVFESLTHHDIGTLLDITPENSRWHLNRARRNLKEKLNVLNK